MRVIREAWRRIVQLGRPQKPATRRGLLALQLRRRTPITIWWSANQPSDFFGDHARSDDRLRQESRALRKGIAVLSATAVLIFGLDGGPASAKTRPRDDVGAIIAALTACGTIADTGSRLACFDGAAPRLAQATSKGDVRIIDREDVRQTRRSLFGFTLPKVAFFKGDDTADDTPSEIDTTIESVAGQEYGKYTLVLEDGAVWRTTEPLPRDPRVGVPVHLKRGALGNYFIRVGTMRAVSTQRVR